MVLRGISDKRQSSLCAYCGGPVETRDHVPSKVFLDSPYPVNLPVVPSCEACNSGFSPDEQYTACLIECTLAGSARWEDIERECIAITLKKDRRIKSQMEGARQTMIDESTWFRVEDSRISAVVLKLARGHAAYELAEPQLEEPESVLITTLIQMNSRQRAVFEEIPSTSIVPEVGSRAMQLVIEEGSSWRLFQRWTVVQPNNYRYLTLVDDIRVTVRFVIREYLACEVIWLLG